MRQLIPEGRTVLSKLEKTENTMIEKAKWIMAADFQREVLDLTGREQEKKSKQLPEHSKELQNYHMLVRKVFRIGDIRQKVILSLTADDYYKVFINGQYIGQGPAPSYPDSYYYNEYDISSALRAGENVIALDVYYQGLVNRVWNSGDYRQGMQAVICCGGRILERTDETWKYCKAQWYGAGGIVGYQTQFLENLDAGKLERGWKTLDFCDAHWKNAAVKEQDDHRLLRQDTATLEVYPIVPELVKEYSDGSFLLDCKTEVVGGVRLQGQGIAGEKVRILAGEELLPDGHVRFRMRSNCDYEEEWTLSGREDVLENYDYKVFRYLEVGSQYRSIGPENISVMVRHYPFKDTTKLLECSHGILSEIWNLCSRSVQMGTQEVFVDCPGREKGQYLGDMTITARNHLYLTGDDRMYRKALLNFAESAKIDKGLMAVAPGNVMQEIADYSLLYPMQVFQYYEYTQDREFLRSIYPAVKEVAAHFAAFQREDGLLEGVADKWNMVDWPENLRDDYEFPLTIPVGSGCHNVINAYYYGALLYLEKIERALELDTAERLKELERVRQAFWKVFYDEDRMLFRDAQGVCHCALHSNGIALFFGLEKEESRKSIAGLIRTKGLNCGVYTAYFILKGLCRIGEYQLMYDLMTGEGEHSWCNMLREGATTCFEAWGKDQKWNTSLCHPWGSGPILLILEDILGLRCHKNGDVLEAEPHLPEQIRTLTLLFKGKNKKSLIRVNDGNVQIEEWKE